MRAMYGYGPHYGYTFDEDYYQGNATPLPDALKSLFLELKRSGNSLLKGDTDASIKEKTGTGDVITFFQLALTHANPNLTLNRGVYDADMEAAVLAFQQEYNQLKTDSQAKVGEDGDLGRITISKMYASAPDKYTAPRRSQSPTKKSDSTGTRTDTKLPSKVGMFDLNPFFRLNNFWLYFSGAMVGVALYAIFSDDKEK